MQGRDHPSADKRETYEVGIFIWVETEAFDDSEAPSVAEAALNLPGTWANRKPLKSTGVINGYNVKAQINRSQAIYVKKVQDD